MSRDLTAASAKELSAIYHDGALKTLLLHLTYGKHDQAEEMIKANPNLLNHKDKVTDPSERIFHKITPLQYVLWALYKEAWTMILCYLSTDEALEQLTELEDKGTAHGLHYDFNDLLQPLKRYIESYVDLSKPRNTNFDTCQINHHPNTTWHRLVGPAKARAPAHVITNAHSQRNFNSKTSKNNRSVTCLIGIGSMGEENPLKKDAAEKDYLALAELAKTRIRQYNELKIMLLLLKDIDGYKKTLRERSNEHSKLDFFHLGFSRTAKLESAEVLTDYITNYIRGTYSLTPPNKEQVKALKEGSLGDIIITHLKLTSIRPATIEGLIVYFQQKTPQACNVTPGNCH